jgi:hypothetical protein
VCEDNIKMYFEGAGNGGKEQIDLTENRFKMWTFFLLLEEPSIKGENIYHLLSINVSPHSGLVVVAMSSNATAKLSF